MDSLPLGVLVAFLVVDRVIQIVANLSKSRVEGSDAEHTETETQRLYLDNYNQMFESLLSRDKRIADLSHRVTTAESKLAQVDQSHAAEIAELRGRLDKALQELDEERALRLRAEESLKQRDERTAELTNRVSELEAQLRELRGRSTQELTAVPAIETPNE
ncbi:hypothetical protein Rctr85_016 [Virus Rctr85]|nr:hypothetical protein Rctr85_016 [Virus Rctr85]